MAMLSAETMILPTVPVMDGISHQFNQTEGEHGEIHALQPERQSAHKQGKSETCCSADDHHERQGQVGTEQG